MHDEPFAMLPLAHETHVSDSSSKYAFYPPVHTQEEFAVFTIAFAGHDTHFPFISIASFALHTHVPLTSCFRLFVHTQFV